MAAMKADWLRAAMCDDNLVAELLLRLNLPDSRPPRRSKMLPPLPPLDWGMRLPRSKAAAAPSKKELEATRRSPTTPLSWTTSNTASPGDSCEESNLLLDRLLYDARFKGNATNDTNNSVSGSKRPRKKKTFVELKEVESSLLEERKRLNKCVIITQQELESLRLKFDEHRSSNENLKRIKLDLHAQLVPKSLPTVNKHMGMGQHESKVHSERDVSSTSKAASPSNVSKRVKSEELSDNLCLVQNESSNEQPIFELPDLNMMPEEDFAPESAVEIS